MQPNYEARETEHVEQIETTSAGLKTQRLAQSANATPSSPQGATYLGPSSKRNNMLALVLIALGALMAVGQVAPSADQMTGGFVLFTIASGLLFFAFWRGIYGLLIPGSILAGLSVGVSFASLTNGVSVLWGLALGFLAIFLIGRSWFNVQSPWPMFPAVPLFCIGVIVAIANVPIFLGAGLMWLPLLLIGAGLVLGWRRRTA